MDSNGQQQGPVAANDLPRYGVTPHTSVWKDSISGWQLAGNVAELSAIFATPTPAYAPQQPAYAPQQPAYAPQQPAYTPQQPVHAPQQPMHAPQQPMHAPQQPMHAPQQPAYAPQQPAYAPQQPAHAPQQPAYTPQQPMHAPQQPAHAPQPAHVQQVNSGTKKVYNMPMVIVGALFGGFLVAGYFIAENYKANNEPDKAKKITTYATIGFIAYAVLTFIPGSYVLFLFLMSIGSLIAVLTMYKGKDGKKINALLASGGVTAFGWGRVIAITLIAHVLNNIIGAIG